MLKLTTRILCISGMAMATAVPVNALDTRAAMQHRLEERYPLTRATQDQTDIVSPGARLILKKSSLLMVPVNSPNLFQNLYERGRITQNSLGKASEGLRRACGLLSICPPTPTTLAPPATRAFVAGEKLWVTEIRVTDKSVLFQLLSDPYPNFRYKASLTIPYSGEPDTVVGEVLAVESAPRVDTPPTDPQPQPAPEVLTTPAESPHYDPIDPPPPPPPDTPGQPTRTDPDRPNLRHTSDVTFPTPSAAPHREVSTTVAVGDTADQVIAALGRPSTIARLSDSREIYFYPKIKLTLANRRVIDIQRPDGN